MRAVGFIGVAIALGLGVVLASRGAGASPPSPISYFIADGSKAGGFRPGDRQLASWAFDAWRRAAGPGLRFEAATETEAVVRLYWAEPSRGLYGEMKPLLVGGRRGAAVFIQADVNLLGDAIADRAARDELFRDSIVYLTCVHELGHALGLPHTSDFRDIMYSFGFGGDILDYFGRYRAQLHTRTDIARVAGLSDADTRRITALHSFGSHAQ